MVTGRLWPAGLALVGLLAHSLGAPSRASNAGTPPTVGSVGTPGDGLAEVRSLLKVGRYADAAAAARSRLAIVDATDGPDSVAAAVVLDLLVQALRRAGKAKDPESRRLAERALAIRESALGPDHPDTAASLSSLANLLRDAGEHAAARPLDERALAIRESALGPDHPDVASSLNNLANVLHDQGDYAGAVPLQERALSIKEKALGPDHPDLATSLNNLASVLFAMGDWAGAEPLYRRAVAIREKALGPEHELVASGLGNLGAQLLVTGDYAGAKPLLERALAIREKALGPDHPSVAVTLTSLAWLLKATDDKAGAKRLHERALAIRERALGPESPHVATSLGHLASLHGAMGDLVGGRALDERALAIRENVHGPDHVAVAESLNNLGALLWQAGQRAAAGSLFERALVIREKALGPCHFRVAETLTNVAEFREEEGDLGAAIQLHERALVIREDALGASHPSVASSLSRLARLARDSGDGMAALELALRAEAVSRAHLQLTARSLGERQALGYATVRATALDVAVSVASSGRVADAGSSAWDAAIRSRTLVLDVMSARHRAVSRSAQPELAALAQEHAAAAQRLANLAVRGPGADAPERYRKLLDDAREAKERMEEALAQRSASFRETRARSRLGLAEVAEALPRRQALVAFLRYAHRELALGARASGAETRAVPAPAPIASYVAFVLRGGELEPTVVSLGPAETIDTLAARWREAAADPASSEAACRAAGRALRRAAWDPVALHLEGSRRVFVVPDGALHLVSFAALPADGVEDGAYLVEVGPSIHYLTAERDLVLSRVPPRASEGLLAIGGPSFDDTVAFAALAAAPQTDAVPRVIAGLRPFRGETARCAGFASLRFDPLPGAEQEALEVAAAWRESSRDGVATPSVVQLSQGGASEAAFKAAAPGKRVLHLATHGFFLGGTCQPAPAASRGMHVAADADDAPLPSAGENTLLLSGLALAGANRRAAATLDEEDGILTAEEIASMDLSGVEWAVLSACGTGLGDVRAGEGVFGLRRAFHVAGARTVIMSLWSVDDQATRRWMRELYRARLERGLETSECVREASLAVLRDQRARGLSTHPFRWAAFVAAGEWR